MQLYWQDTLQIYKDQGFSDAVYNYLNFQYIHLFSSVDQYTFFTDKRSV